MADSNTFAGLDEPAEPHAAKDGSTTRGGIMFVPRPSRNSLSLTIHVMRLRCGADDWSPSFEESENEPLPHPGVDLHCDESLRARLFVLYESIAESTGNGLGDYDLFAQRCVEEGLPVLPVPGFKRST